MSIDSPHHFMFYSRELGSRAGSLELSGDEHHHVARVLRLGPGTEVHVTDGEGLLARCSIEAVGKDTTRLSVLECGEAKAPGPEVVLALGCLRKDAFEQAMKQCTELGMNRCVPFASEKSHFKEYSQGFLDRLNRVVLSAMKQSFRTTLPAIEPAIDFDGLLTRLQDSDAVITGDPGGGRPSGCPGAGVLTLVVGPEGGLTGAECEALVTSGSELVSISSNRLRSETAAVALMALAADLCQS